MISGVWITLVGLPEKVQRVADALDRSLPGSIAWHDVAEEGEQELIRLEGVGVPLLDGIAGDDTADDGPKMVRSTSTDLA